MLKVILLNSSRTVAYKDIWHEIFFFLINMTSLISCIFCETKKKFILTLFGDVKIQAFHAETLSLKKSTKSNTD
jgi:hypothetical protein